MTTMIVVVSVIAGLLVVWFCYMLIKSGDVLKDIEGSNAPYKVDPPHTITTVDVAIPAIPHEPIKWEYENLEPKPEKRTYIKRSKYWTDKRKKAAAAKARKTKRK